jgi:predicted nucleic acid-binding Zn ribbon protein
VQRLLSAPALVFKGTGWYVTDYPNADRKKAMEAEKTGSGNGGAAAPSSADSKESKTPAKD